MNLKLIGWQRSVRGFREGNRSMLLGGLAMLAFHYLRSSRPRRELIYRRKVPVGTEIVIRHRRP